MSINKDSQKAPKLRFKGFTDDWEQRRLGDTLVELKSGLSRMLSNNDIGLPVIRANNIKNGILDLETDIKYWYSNDPQGANTENYLVEEGNILINFINSDAKMGTAAIVREAISRNTIYTTNILKAQTNSDFNPYFWFTLTQTLQYKNSIKMITKPAINQSSFTTVDFKKLIFDFPKLSEQSKIGNFIKLIDNTITHHQRKLDQLNQLKEALLQQMFPGKGETVPKLRFAGFEGDWEERKLKDVSDMYDNLRVPVTASDRIAGETPYYGANGIQDYVKDYTHIGEFVLIAEDGANDLVNYPVHYVTGEVWVNNHAHVVSGIEGQLDNLFLVSRLKSMNLTPWLVGGGRAKLNGDVLKKLPIIIPHLEEQQKIGSFFKHLDNTIILYQGKLDQLQNMKQVLLENMFI